MLRAVLLVVVGVSPAVAWAVSDSAGARSAHAPGVAAEGLPAGYTVEYLMGVAVVLLALGALAFAARRMQGRGTFGRGALRVESSLALGARERLMIVQVEGERLLLGVGAGGVRALSHLPPRPAGPQAELPPDGWLARTLRREAQ